MNGLAVSNDAAGMQADTFAAGPAIDVIPCISVLSRTDGRCRWLYTGACRCGHQEHWRRWYKGSQLVNADLVEQDLEVFPAGLAGRVTGSKTIAGEQLYGIDSGTGQAPRICVQMNSLSPAPISVDGMSSGPVDGCLCGVANPGNDSYLLKAGPDTAVTVDIDDVHSFARVTAATCVPALHCTFHSVPSCWRHDPGYPGSTVPPTLIAAGRPL